MGVRIRSAQRAALRPRREIAAKPAPSDADARMRAVHIP
jgi:hypothetical protein